MGAASSAPTLLKWAGSKRRLAPALAARLPPNFTHYVEPFCGSCAVFFHLWHHGYRGAATLSDNLAPLTSFLRAVAQDPQGVLAEYQWLCALPQTAATYLRIRRSPPLLATPFAGWFLYINRAGFNGLWRVNAQGGFNVPWGKHLKLPDLALTVQAASDALRTTVLSSGSATFCLQHLLPEALEGTVVFVDPPYLGMFSAYTADGFNLEDHQRLASVLNTLLDRGAFCAISGSATEATTAVYGPLGLQCDVLPLTHTISRGDRPPLSEYLFFGSRRGKP